jgi:hypothetical protein
MVKRVVTAFILLLQGPVGVVLASEHNQQDHARSVDVEKILAAFRSEVGRVHNFKASISMRTTTPARAVMEYFANRRRLLQYRISTGHDREVAQVLLGSLEQQKQKRLRLSSKESWEVLVALDGRYLLRGTSPSRWRTQKGKKLQALWFAYDGTRFVRFTELSSVKTGRVTRWAVIEAEQHKLQVPCFETMLLGPVRLCSRCVPGLDTQGNLYDVIRRLTAKEGFLRIESTPERLNQADTIIFASWRKSTHSSEAAGSHRYLRLWFSLQSGRRPLKLQVGSLSAGSGLKSQRVGELPSIEWEWTEHLRSPEGVWVATRGRIVYFIWDKLCTPNAPLAQWPLHAWPWEAVEFTIGNLETNIPLTAQDFELIFPSGTGVVDKIRNTGHYVDRIISQTTVALPRPGVPPELPPTHKEHRSLRGSVQWILLTLLFLVSVVSISLFVLLRRSAK